MEYIIALLIFAFVITLLVFIHEFGHFFAAKKSGVKVEEFALGMGPKIYSFKRGETEYSLRLFPIGGYVSMLGENDFEKSKNDDPTKKSELNPRSYAAKSAWIRSYIVILGVVMNFLFAILIYSIMGLFTNFTFIFPQVPDFPLNHFPFGDQRNANVGTIIGNNYNNTQIPQKIVISSVNGHKYNNNDEFINLINQSFDKNTEIYASSVLGGGIQKYTIVPKNIYPSGTVVIESLKDSVAHKAGIPNNYLVQKAGNQDVTSIANFKTILNDNKDKSIKIEGLDLITNKQSSYDIIPQLDTTDSKYKIGVSLTEIQIINTQDKGVIIFDGTVANVREYHGVGKLLAGFGETANLSQYTLSILGQSIGRSFEQKSLTPVSGIASGPVGIFVTVKTLMNTLGFFGIVQLVAIISLSLAVFNLMPFPGLDGWHLYNNLVEAITKKRLPAKVFNFITIAGFSLLIILILLITVKDLFTFVFK